MATDADFSFKGGDTTVLAKPCLWDQLGILGSFRKETFILVKFPYKIIYLPDYLSLTTKELCIKPFSVGGSYFKVSKTVVYSPESDFITICHFA